MEQIRLPICISSLNNVDDIKNLLLQYSRFLNLHYKQYQDLYILARVSSLSVELPINEEVSEKEYLESIHDINCNYFKKKLKYQEYCYICNAGADCNKYKREEEFIIAYLLQNIKNNSTEVWHQLKGIVTKNNFVSKYEYREGPPFNILGFLIELILFNMNPIKLKVDYLFDLEGKFFKELPSYIKDELKIQLEYLSSTSLPEQTFEHYIEKNNVLPKLIEHSNAVNKKLDSINNENTIDLKEVNPTEEMEDDVKKGQVNNESNINLLKNFILGDTLLKGTPMENIKASSIEPLDVSIAEVVDVEEPEEVEEEVEQFEKLEEVEEEEVNKPINTIENPPTEENQKLTDETSGNIINGHSNYFVTSTNDITPLDCIKISNTEQFNNTYLSQRLGVVRKAVRLEFVPETKELFSYSKDTNEPIIYTFEDEDFTETFGKQIIESRGFHSITFNSIPLINYFDNKGHYLQRKKFFDLQLGYTMANFPKDRNKVITLEDFGLLEKNNDYKDYRSKVFASIKGYHDLYDKFMEYWDMRELQFRKKYKDEIGLRYLVGRSSELEISTGRGREIVVKNARGFNYDWLLDPGELINRKDILVDKMLVVGTFKNLRDYVEHSITEDNNKTPLGYPVKVCDEYTLEELKVDVCKEVVRTVLISMMRHWKSERSSLRLLYFDHEKIILMVDNNIAGRGLAFDSLYYGMGHVPKELLPGIVPENDILEIR